MAEKMIPISTRIHQDDVEFISQLKVAGATTPSDKLRSIIADARLRSDGMQDYRSGFQLMQELFAPVREHIREAELATSSHSEMVTRLVEWLPDTVAYLMSAMHRSDNEIDKKDLLDLEDGITERIFRLVVSVMHMGVTKECPCYNTHAVSERMQPVLELTDLISKQSNNRS